MKVCREIKFDEVSIEEFQKVSSNFMFKFAIDKDGVRYLLDRILPMDEGLEYLCIMNELDVTVKSTGKKYKTLTNLSELFEIFEYEPSPENLQAIRDNNVIIEYDQELREEVSDVIIEASGDSKDVYIHLWSYNDKDVFWKTDLVNYISNRDLYSILPDCWGEGIDVIDEKCNWCVAIRHIEAFSYLAIRKEYADNLLERASSYVMKVSRKFKF